MKTPVTTQAAPAAIGTYSQAIEAAGLLYLSGQIPLEPATGALVSGSFRVEVDRVLDNLAGVLAAAGTGLDAIVKWTVYLTDLAYFGEVNDAMNARLRAPYPARAVVQVAGLPRGARVEIDAIAVTPRGT